MENEKKRQATYTITVPLQITFATDDDLSDEQFYRVAESEVYKRLSSGYFDVLTDKIDVKNKVKHRTREEINAEKRAWQEFFAAHNVRGVRK